MKRIARKLKFMPKELQMKRSAIHFVTLVALILFLVPALAAAENAKTSADSVPPMTGWQARRAVAAGLSQASPASAARDSFRFTSDGIEFDTEVIDSVNHFTRTTRVHVEHIKVDLKTLEPVFAKREHYSAVLKNEAGKDLPHRLSRFQLSGAGPVAAALNRLRAVANDTGAPARFKQQAAAWRALSSKAASPEEVREHPSAGGKRHKGNKPEEALKHYETGLELYSTWPQGYFNAALIAAESGYHAEAVEQMQAVPGTCS